MRNITTINILLTKLYDPDFFFVAQICEIRPILAKNPPEPYFLP